MGIFDRLRGRRPAAPVHIQIPSHQPPQSGAATASTSTTGFYAPPPPTNSPGARFVVLDVETTGLRADSHRVLEIALVTVDGGRVVGEWTSRLDPQGPVGATHIHGITAADVVGAPRFCDVLPELNHRLAGAAVAAHNAPFDLAFLRAEYHRAGWTLPHVPTLCTLAASSYHLPHLDRRRLADCCWAAGVTLHGAHSALGDARATAELLALFMDTSRGLPPRPEDLDALRTALTLTWPTTPSHPPLTTDALARRQRPAPPQRVRTMLATPKPDPQTLVELIERFSLVDALDEGAPEGALAYLEKLAEVLEDGELTEEEAADLAAVVEVHALSADDVAAANQAFVLALAHAALSDGKVTRAERAELVTVTDLLGVPAKVLTTLLDRAEQARHARLGAGLAALPDPWPHGDPLRVGDKVVFTGCDDTIRIALERQSEEIGVRIVSSVSAKTAMLVTDGTFDGTKASKAREVGTRVVHPDVYAQLLRHLQPALPRGASSQDPARAGLEGLRPTAARDDHATGRRAALDATHPCPENAGAAPAPADVRRWAREQGLEVGVRGRLPADLLAAYLAAN